MSGLIFVERGRLGSRLRTSRAASDDTKFSFVRSVGRHIAYEVLGFVKLGLLVEQFGVFISSVRGKLFGGSRTAFSPHRGTNKL